MQYNLLNKLSGRACGIVALAAFASAAWAAPETAAPVPSGVTAANTTATAPVTATVTGTAPAKAQETPARVAIDFGPAADLGKLEQSRGGTDVHNDMKLDGVVTGNSAVNVITGANSIDTGAFANMSGIPVVIQNSGANVLIQNATIVNLQFK